MCITFSPAELSNTILLAHSITLGERKVNVLGYQNKASSAGPCAMILPIPSKEDMSAANCIDMSACPKLFAGYAELVQPRSRGGGDTKGARSLSFGVEVFNSGSYTVVLARNASEIPAALDQVPVLRRPEMNQALCEAMERWYPGYWFALCCWDGTIEAEPMLWWYEPLPAFEDNHFLPGLDGHDGGIPDIHQKSVPVDHTIVVGRPQARLDFGNALHLLLSVPEAQRRWLPDHVTGDVFKSQMRNGDWVLPKHAPNDAMRRRVPPPGA